MSRKRILTAWLAVVIVVALVAPVTAPQRASAQTDLARVRFLHAVPGAPSVDVYVDDTLAVSDLAFGDYTPHMNVTAGEHRVAVRQAGTGADAVALLEVSVPLTGGLAFSVVMQGAVDAPAASLYEDILDEIALGLARLTAINAMADAPALDVLTTAGGPLLQGVSYGSQFGTVNIGTGIQDLVMVPAGGAVESAVAAIGQVPLRSGMLYTFVALGALDGTATPFTVVMVTPVNGAADAVKVQVGNGSPDAGAVDVYGNDQLLFPSVQLGELTGHVALPAGEYALALRTAGAAAGDPALLETTVTLDAGAVTLVAQGEAADKSLTLAQYPDAVADVTSTAARIAVVNAVPGATVGAVSSDAAATVLASAVAAGAQAPAVSFAPGEYMLTVSVQGVETPVDLVIPAQPYYGGIYYTVLVFGGGASAMPFDARTSGTEVVVMGDSLLLAGAQPVAAVPTVEPTTAAEVAAPVATAADVAAVLPTAAPATDATANTEVVADTSTSANTEVVTDTGTSANTEVVADAAPVETAAPIIEPTQAPQVTAGPVLPIGTVMLNPGANLHCRVYPNSQAQSLAMIPSGAQVTVLGIPGEATAPDTGEATVTPIPTPVIASIEELWLSVRYDTGDGGYLDCWVAAQFLQVTYKRVYLIDLEDYLESDLPIIPFNQPGEAVGTSPTPPTPIFNAVLATVQLEPGVSLQLRRYPNATAEALARIPAQSQVEALSWVAAPSEGLVGQPTDPNWIQVRYRMENGASTVGWISGQYITLSQLDRPVAIEDLPEGDPTQGGYFEEAGTPLIPAEMQAVVGVVTLNPGANLNLRDRPSVDGYVVVGIPSGAVMVLNGRSGDGMWVQVTYETSGQKLEGWTSSQYLTITQGGVPYGLQRLPILTAEEDLMLLPTPTPTPVS